ncbi:MAG: hypothetical protein BWZ02_03130 [Lentisphaerae bacterium ADurb.BinA184]|nr:MAG: hypothetical protein BWZ02_03130 [Lentisphaerae bacterium ADurb.BinA184]
MTSVSFQPVSARLLVCVVFFPHEAQYRILLFAPVGSG